MATRVTITKALEAKLREINKVEEPCYGAMELVEELVKILDDEQGKRAAGSKDQDGAKTGLGYKELVALLRSFLGSDLLTPPKPNTAFIIKIVNRAKEQGLDSNNVEQIIRGLRRCVPRGPYRIGDIIYNIDRYYAAGEGLDNVEFGRAVRQGDVLPDAENQDAVGETRLVYSGRPTYDIDES